LRLGIIEALLLVTLPMSAHDLSASLDTGGWEVVQYHAKCLVEAGVLDIVELRTRPIGDAGEACFFFPVTAERNGRRHFGQRRNVTGGVIAEVGGNSRERPGVFAAPPVDDFDRFGKIGVTGPESAAVFDRDTKGLGENLAGPINPRFAEAVIPPTPSAAARRAGKPPACPNVEG
jgi:hypothetical protein